MFSLELVVFIISVSVCNGIICYRCSNSDLPSCNSIVECRRDEICTGHSLFTVNGPQLYSLGCAPKTICDQFIFGKRELSAGCCSTNYCNKNLFEPKTTIRIYTTTNGSIQSTNAATSLMTTEKVTTTTTPPPPPMTTFKPITCEECTGPLFICKVTQKPIICADPSKRFCKTQLVNNADGTRNIRKGCATETECVNDWYTMTSDDDRCMNFDPNYLVTLSYKCTYCCTSDTCNNGIIPIFSSLYRPRK